VNQGGTRGEARSSPSTHINSGKSKKRSTGATFEKIAVSDLSDPKLQFPTQKIEFFENFGSETAKVGNCKILGWKGRKLQKNLEKVGKCKKFS